MSSSKVLIQYNMKRKDIKLLSCIICIILILLISRFIPSDSISCYVRITESGKETGIYPLDVDADITLSHNTIHIEDHVVSVTDADCPDRLCIHQGGISKPGQVIACLPGRTVIQIVANDSPSMTSPMTYSGIHFDTLVDVKIYDISASSDLPDIIRNECTRYEYICSRTDKDSELYRLNHRLISNRRDFNYNGMTVTAYRVSSELYDMISAGISAYRQSDGLFDISIAPVSQLWSFSDGKHSIPSSQDVALALTHVSADNIILFEDHYIGFKDEDCMIDLGGLAKGYIGDRLYDTLKEHGVSSALISLGGNVVALGDKAGRDFTVGIRQPFASGNEAALTLSVSDTSVITSGTYERYFISDGRLYHHILDPATGYPFDTDLSSATVTGCSSVNGDILSTVLLAEGSARAIGHADRLKNEDIAVILIDNNGDIIYNSCS